MTKFQRLLRSRKFWAALAGLLVVTIDTAWPGFPFTPEQLTAFVVVMAAYILGVALDDGAKP